MDGSKKLTVTRGSFAISATFRVAGFVATQTANSSSGPSASTMRA
jgi:hypothetical protein